MPASNVARLGIGIQAAKGDPETVPLFWLNFTGGNIRPAPETEQRSETGLGRDVGDTYIRVLSASGDPSVLLRPDSAVLLYYAVLGAKAASGSGPFTHTLTPANDQPWLTVFKEHGDAIYEAYYDCKVTALNVEWTPGGDLAASLSIVGLDFEFLSASPGGGVHDQEIPFRVPGAEYRINNVVNDDIISGNFNIEATQTPVQTNQIRNSHLVPGTRTIGFGFEGVFTDADLYRQIFYGSASGTTPALNVYEDDFQFTFGDYTNGPGIRYTVQRALFGEGEPSLDPGGAPMTISVGGTAGRPASGAITEVEVVNDRAGTFYAPAA